jgi:tRNA(fMet)-specific endonuclease VapC
MTDFLRDTNTASCLIRADRSTVNAMRRSRAQSIAVSAVTQSELLYGARLRPDRPALMSAVQGFLARVTVHSWDAAAAETHAALRANARQDGRSAGTFDLMIAAHALALDATLVTSDKAIGNLNIEGLKVVAWREN